MTRRLTPFPGPTALKPLLIACVVLLGALAACSENVSTVPAEAAAPILQGEALHFPQGHPQLALLRVVPAAPGKAMGVDLPARLVWNEQRTQRVYPAFAGRVTRIAADVGQRVAPGAVLAQMASPDFGQAQADAANAQTGLRLTRSALLRQRELFEAGIVARKDLEQAEADASRAEAEAARSAGRTRLYGNAAAGGSVNQQLALTASLGGIVVERNLNPGQELRPEQSGPGVPALFVISDPSVLWVQVDARESEVGSLLPGSTFELRVPAYPGRKFTARVSASADFIDPTSRTIKVRGVVDNPDRLLKAEMLATAHFERSLGSGVVVPASAVVLRGDKHWVFMQRQPGVFELREVRIGHQGPADVVVSQGLEVGDAVVADNLLLLVRQFSIAKDNLGLPSGAASKASP